MNDFNIRLSVRLTSKKELKAENSFSHWLAI